MQIFGIYESFKNLKLNESLSQIENYFYRKYENPKILEFEKFSNLEHIIKYKMFDKRCISENWIDNCVVKNYADFIKFSIFENLGTSYIVISENDIEKFEDVGKFFD
jgi:hypothetical protein